MVVNAVLCRLLRLGDDPIAVGEVVFCDILCLLITFFFDWKNVEEDFIIVEKILSRVCLVVNFVLAWKI